MNDISFCRRNLLKVSGGVLLTGATVAQTVQADSTEITPGEEISGAIGSADDRDEFILVVDQGDVVDIEFEKAARDLINFAVRTPRGQSSFLGGTGSEGETTYRNRMTIEETGVLDISVYTHDSDVEGEQLYGFSADRFDGLDRWPANDEAGIDSGEEVSGTIRSADDRDEFTLVVDQGDVVDMEFEKAARDLVNFAVRTPRGQSSFLGGTGSEGETTYRNRMTIEETGVLDISVYTHDSDEPTNPDEVVEEQPYGFSVDRFDGLDRWPANDEAEIDSREEISGTIRSADDRDTFALVVDQGDVVDIEFEKAPRDLVSFSARTPRGQSSFLGGSGSEGKGRFEDSVSIEETGVLDISVTTQDSDEPTNPDEVIEAQEYRFILNGALSDADDQNIGTVTGQITNATSEPLPEIEIEAIDIDTDTTEATATTDEDGEYAMELAAGTYELVVETDGFEPFVTEIDVEAAETVPVDLELVSDSSGESEVPEEWTNRGLTDEQFEAVVGTEDELTREDIRGAVQGFIRDGTVDGVEFTREDIRLAVEVFIIG